MCRYQTTLSVYMPHINSVQSTLWPKTLVYIHSNYWHMPHEKMVSATLYIYVPLQFYFRLHTNHTLNISIEQQTYLSCYIHICASSIYASQMPYMSITSCGDIRQLCLYIYLIWTHCNEHCDQEHGYTCNQYYRHMPLNKYVCHIAHMSHCTSTCRCHINPTLLHTSIKNQYTTTLIYHTTVKYVQATNVPLKCHISATYELSGINHVTRSAVHQTTITLMQMPNYIRWVGHWPNQPRTELTLV